MANQLVLLPIDGSPTAEAAARFAVDIARAEPATVLVLGVVVEFPVGREHDDLEHAVGDFMSRMVAEEAGRIRHAGVEAEPLVIEADTPQEGILLVAEERHVDVIVMGTHGVTGWRRSVLGSVADSVVRNTRVPVVLVPLKEGE